MHQRTFAVPLWAALLITLTSCGPTHREAPPTDAAADPGSTFAGSMGAEDPLAVSGAPNFVVTVDGNRVHGDTSRTYRLQNRGTETLQWTAAADATWIQLSKTDGVLEPGAEDSLDATVNPAVAAAMTPGSYQASVSFSNLRTGRSGRTFAVANVPPQGAPAPILPPGPGFSGPTPTPGRVGSGSGSDAKVIGRWDVVPHQRLDDDFHVGVVAFHKNGVERVDFSLNGGPWTSVRSMTLNPRTGVHEYFATIDPSRVMDGEVEVRAIAYPNVGIPRLLEPLFLISNGQRSLPARTVWVATNGNDSSGDGSSANPFRTISRAAWAIHQRSGNGRADGGVIYLKAGDHAWGPQPASNQSPRVDREWLTVTAAPGLSRSAVRITSGGNLGTGARLMHIKGLTVTTRLGTSAGDNDIIWAENIEFIGGGRTVHSNFIDHLEWRHKFFTGPSLWRDAERGPGRANLARGIELRNIGHDAFQDAFCLINCKVDGITPISGAHPDMYQAHYGGANYTMENVILYNVAAYNCDAQLIFINNIGRLDNVAFVNVLVEKSGTWGLASQWLQPGNHVLFWFVTMIDQTMMWREPAGQLTNLSVVGCVWHSFGYGAPTGGNNEFRDNHYVSGSDTPGSNVSTGNPGFRSPDTDDYSPGTSSVLPGRIQNPTVPGDIFNRPRSASTTVGAIE